MQSSCNERSIQPSPLIHQPRGRGRLAREILNSQFSIPSNPMKRIPTPNNFKSKGLIGIAVTVLLTVGCGLLYAINSQLKQLDIDDEYDEE